MIVLTPLKKKMDKTPKKQKTLTRYDLVKVMSSGVSTHEEARQVLEVVLDEIAKRLSKGEPVKISSFGTFLVHQKKERPGKNPRTGKSVVVSARTSVSFRASKDFKEKVRTGDS